MRHVVTVGRWAITALVVSTPVLFGQHAAPTTGTTEATRAALVIQMPEPSTLAILGLDLATFATAALIVSRKKKPR